MKNKLKWGALAPAAAALVLALAACNETFVGIEADADVVEASESGDVGSSYTINGTVYLVDDFGELTSLANNDTSWTWWDGDTEYVDVSGNFCLVFWWTQSADDYADNTLEIIADSTYWDYSLGSAVDTGWGDLYSSDNASLATGSSLLGDWQVVVLRYGTTLAVMATNSDYTFYYTDTSFTTSDCSIGFTGNPAAGIDEDTLYYMLGEVTGTKVATTSGKSKTATYNGSVESVFDSVTVYYTTALTSSGVTGTAGNVVCTANGTEYSGDAADNIVDIEVDSTTYTLLLSYSSGNWTYVYGIPTDYTAQASGTALSDTVTVNATIVEDNVTVNSVTVGSTECTENDDGTWIYDTTVSYDSENGLTYTVTAIELTYSNDSFSYTVAIATGSTDTSFGYSYKVAADTTGYTPFLAGDTCTYYINGYSVGGDTTSDLSIEVDSSSGWWAGHYVIGESSASDTTSSSGYSDIVSGASNAVTISSDNSPIAVWGKSSNSAGNKYNGPCLVLATSSTEALVIRTDPYGWDDWYSSSNFTTYSDNTSDESSLLKNCVWCWTITYNSSSETIITFQAYAVSSSSE